MRHPTARVNAESPPPAAFALSLDETASRAERNPPPNQAREGLRYADFRMRTMLATGTGAVRRGSSRDSAWDVALKAKTELRRARPVRCAQRPDQRRDRAGTARVRPSALTRRRDRMGAGGCGGKPDNSGRPWREAGLESVRFAGRCRRSAGHRFARARRGLEAAEKLLASALEQGIVNAQSMRGGRGSQQTGRTQLVARPVLSAAHVAAQRPPRRLASQCMQP